MKPGSSVLKTLRTWCYPIGVIRFCGAPSAETAQWGYDEVNTGFEPQQFLVSDEFESLNNSICATTNHDNKMSWGLLLGRMTN